MSECISIPLWIDKLEKHTFIRCEKSNEINININRNACDIFEDKTQHVFANLILFMPQLEHKNVMTSCFARCVFAVITYQPWILSLMLLLFVFNQVISIIYMAPKISVANFSRQSFSYPNVKINWQHNLSTNYNKVQFFLRLVKPPNYLSPASVTWTRSINLR